MCAVTAVSDGVAWVSTTLSVASSARATAMCRKLAVEKAAVVVERIHVSMLRAGFYRCGNVRVTACQCRLALAVRVRVLGVVLPMPRQAPVWCGV